jgi:shikimate dehydrogenase
MKEGEYRGANVTSPHKQIVMSGLDELSEEARVIGAANTIVFEGGKATGHNTDVAGFASSLSDAMPFEDPFTAAVLGTGGAARAAIYVLLRRKGLRSLIVYSREGSRAEAVAAMWNDPRVHGESLDRFTGADLAVHATPVGLAGAPGALLDREHLRGTGLLYEMIYSPAETALMRHAREAGVRAIGGGGMFIGQGLAAFTLWTGMTADPAEVPDDLFD